MTWKPKPAAKTWAGHLSPIYDTGVVDPLDIVMLLGRTRRFGNMGSLEWSVLHHSMLVVMIWLRAGFPWSEIYVPLTHDAHEAYLGDQISPVKLEVRKRAGGVDGLGKLEADVDARIRDFFSSTGEPGIKIEAPTAEQLRKLKLCDMAAVLVEARFFGGEGASCLGDLSPEIREETLAVVELAFPNLDEVLERKGKVGL